MLDSFPDDPFATTVVVIIALGFVLVIGILLTAVVRGSVQWSRNNASPVETLTARVTGKRTSVSGGHGDSSASTWYHATFELPDGRRDELAISAKDYAQLAEGDRGQLTRQGTRFKGFRRDGVSGSAR
ncbi:DUF2500 domain-containing protein [Janibacter melonis]|jgi:hypothetical protein|uniref:DUF2500 domain-containing protein n=1 Tax=Janibacter melonis TaxID=262209 RepID=UPI001E2B35B0|nr:DUF2500 domain-containing protein [Janibacter melonis]MCB5992407.1 DUF2500 domain-containing protein [Janibacter melonis]MCM3555861.1 DUF2500 domain-containing protein [Janibacter melonis]